MQTHLSHILPVGEAGEILGDAMMIHMTQSLLRFQKDRRSSSTSSSSGSSGPPPPPPIGELEVPTLVATLMYRPPPPSKSRRRDHHHHHHNDDDDDDEYDHDSMDHHDDEEEEEEEQNAAVTTTNDPTYSSSSSSLLPPHIRAGWNYWYTHPALQFDLQQQQQHYNNKQSLLLFLVPHSIQPGGIQPAASFTTGHSNHSNNNNNHNNFGHMGLFDCWIYALQGHLGSRTTTTTTATTTTRSASASSSLPSHTTTTTTTSKPYYFNQNNNPAHYNATISETYRNRPPYQPPRNNTVIMLPDLFIFLAICQQYRQYRRDFLQRQLDHDMDDHDDNNNNNKNTEEPEPIEPSSSQQQQQQQQQHDRTNCNVQSAIAGDIHRREQRIVYTMAQLAFRIYRSYNHPSTNSKSMTTTTGPSHNNNNNTAATITRDTIHRFMTDIYGEESYKIPTHAALLDAIFYHAASTTSTATTTSVLTATVTEAQFCSRCLDTVRPDTGSHVLLDWISVLGLTMLPLQSSSLFVNTTTTHQHHKNPAVLQKHSIQQYLHMIYSTKPPLCSIYQLTESRLYEIKRRFHSLVQQQLLPITTTSMIMSLPSDGSTTTTNTLTSSSTSTERGTHTSSNSAIMEANANPSSSSSPTLRHVITTAAFVYGTSSTNHLDNGGGGYVPPTLARLVFYTGYYYRIHDLSYYNNTNDSNSSSRNNNMNATIPTMAFQSMDSTNIGWTLYHVLQFGCIALRRESHHQATMATTTTVMKDNKTINTMDIPLLRFLFAMFLYADQYDTNDATTTTNSGYCRDDDVATTLMDDTVNVLSRSHVTNMILYLLEHAEFRRRVDAPPVDRDDDDDNENDGDDDRNASATGTTKHQHHQGVSRAEEQNVSLSTVVSLGLLDPPEGSKPSSTIVLRTVIDHLLVESGTTATPNCMTFDEFCVWNHYGAKPVINESALNVDPSTDSSSSSNLDASNRSISGSNPGNSKKRRNTIGRGRLNPLMMDLRLIAGVKFGIPPTLASMEVSLIAEIERRHQRRYPTSDVSRRGPRGTVWNVIDAAWFKSWATLVQSVEGTDEDAADGRGDPRSDRVRGLSRISNTGLLIENGSLSLRKEIRWKHDYELIAPLAWSALQAWYDGGPPIQRSVVKYLPISGSTASPHSTNRAPIPTENEIELHPYFATVYLCDVTSRGVARPFQQNYQMSCVSPILVLLVQLCKELDVSADMARLWIIGSTSATNSNALPDGHDVRNDDWILDTSLNIVEQRKRRGVPADERVVLMLELKDKDTGLWPRGVDGKEWSFLDGLSPAPIPTDLGDGIVGLYNMGNTCYLNSSIQCLSHTPILREYFTSKAYYKDINRTNPLGYEGRLAQVSAVLINELWKKSYNSTPHSRRAPGSNMPLLNAPALTPKTFKESLGKFNEIFAGNEQHDAQELLAFLLGGLSEDLNRIVEKPYMEAPDSDGRPDSELADIWWSNHLKREMSIIVALFTGQYKSLLTCRTCKYESARFEPFSFLQLPLPEDDYLSVSLIYYSAKEGCAPMKYCVRVRNDGVLHDVLLSLSKLLIEDETDGNLVENSDPDGVESTSLLDELSLQRARSMSIVVMREGYIARMAANNWLLQDQQNKDSGELPLMHVYEFDPVPETPLFTEGTEYNESGNEEMDQSPHVPSPAFVAVAQRRSELLSRDVLHPLAHRVFGTPFLLRIHDIDSCSGRDLYDQVARRLKGLVQRPVLRFLNIAPDSSYENRKRPANGGAGDHRPGSGISYQTLTDMEDVAAGPVPRYGFRLRLTSRDGRRCLRCAWYESCIGCLVPDDDDPVIVGDGDSIVVDWHFAVDIATNGFGSRNANGSDAIFASQYTPVNNTNRSRPPPVVFKSHSSCGVGMLNGKQSGAVTLEECLDAFSKEEKIPEAYCSKCKDFRVQTKRMSLWRLPPVMIIHLKRFQFTQTMRRKLRDLVVFPTEGLDLSRIMATDPSDGVSSKETKDSNQNGFSSEELKDTGRSEMLYDLYGVVHHQGALSGGHYVASLKSEIDGQWRLFNDAQIYDIHARDVVDPSAYILFYIRRDVANAQLSDYWDVGHGSSAISDQDMDQLLKGRSDRCVIS